MNDIRLRLVCTAGLEQALARELAGCGLSPAHRGRGDLMLCVPPHRALELLADLRCVTRVVWELASGLPATREGLVRAIAALPWESWLPATLPWAARAIGRSDELRHSHFAALLVKDGLRDRFQVWPSGDGLFSFRLQLLLVESGLQHTMRQRFQATAARNRRQRPFLGSKRQVQIL